MEAPTINGPVMNNSFLPEGPQYGLHPWYEISIHCTTSSAVIVPDRPGLWLRSNSLRCVHLLKSGMIPVSLLHRTSNALRFVHLLKSGMLPVSLFSSRFNNSK